MNKASKLFEKLPSQLISLAIPQLIFFIAYAMDKFVYLEATSPITEYKFFWVLSVIASMICLNHNNDILPHIKECREEKRNAIIWAIAIGSVVLFLLFGLGHSHMYAYHVDYGIEI